MKKALVLTNQLNNFAGSEILSLEVAEALVDMGYDVDIKCNLASDALIKSTYRTISVSDSENFPRVADYDFIWSQHNLLPLLEVCADDIKKRGTKIVSAHLSPFEPFETAGLASAILLNAHIVANSPETKEKLVDIGIPAEKILNLKNAAPESFLIEPENRSGELKNLLIVSNHIPYELANAVKLLRKSGLRVKILGRNNGRHQRLNVSDLGSIDAIVSIGKTVQYGILAQKPIYCYDRFGGPGWLNHDNIDVAEYYNFSGRCCGRKLDAKMLSSELIGGFRDAQKEARRIHLNYRSGYLLGKFIKSVINSTSPSYVINDYTNALIGSENSNAKIIRDLYRQNFGKPTLSLRIKRKISQLLS